MAITLALAGDTMLGRGVGEALVRTPPEAVVDDAVVAAMARADLRLANLECCLSERGAPWPDPGKPFFFRGPPEGGIGVLRALGVDAVTLANNHALDYGAEALLDTLEHLRAAGIGCVGAGRGAVQARAPLVLEAGGFRLAVVALSDHPRDFAASPERPGIAFADLRAGVPPWVREAIAGADADAVLVAPHWGPNMTERPVRHVRAAAAALLAAGATLIAGHSAHVFHGVSAHGVLYDLGDFVDDYARDPVLRNDLGVLWLVTLDERGPLRLEAIPLRLDFCHTALAAGADAEWVRRRLVRACDELGAQMSDERGRLVMCWHAGR